MATFRYSLAETKRALFLSVAATFRRYPFRCCIAQGERPSFIIALNMFNSCVALGFLTAHRMSRKNLPSATQRFKHNPTGKLTNVAVK